MLVIDIEYWRSGTCNNAEEDLQKSAYARRSKTGFKRSRKTSNSDMNRRAQEYIHTEGECMACDQLLQAEGGGGKYYTRTAVERETSCLNDS